MSAVHHQLLNFYHTAGCLLFISSLVSCMLMETHRWKIYLKTCKCQMQWIYYCWELETLDTCSRLSLVSGLVPKVQAAPRPYGNIYGTCSFVVATPSIWYAFSLDVYSDCNPVIEFSFVILASQDPVSRLGLQISRYFSIPCRIILCIECSRSLRNHVQTAESDCVRQNTTDSAQQEIR